jgi:signal transduction histidine kinase
VTRRKFWRLPRQVASAVRVALAATVLIGIVYAGCVAALDALLASRFVAQVDVRLSDHLSDGASRSVAGQAGSIGQGSNGSSTRNSGRVKAAGGQADGNGGDADDQDVDGAPMFLWMVRPGGATVTLSASAPPLPRSLRLASGQPWTAQIGPHAFRLAAARQASGSWLVAGQSMAEETHFQRVLVDGEVLAAPVLLLAVFAGSLIIGLRALAPVEQSRRRQLEFTADASHELRTPLSVISAETNIALSSPRDAASYRSALARIQGESQRLRTIVEDLLWLARFDSHPPLPDDEPIDLGVIAEECARRFVPVASAESIKVTVTAAAAGNGMAGHGADGHPGGHGRDPGHGPEPGRDDAAGWDGLPGGDGGLAWISAPPDWIDRLAGVLMDNACRYAGPGGRVRIAALALGNWVSLVVEDSGPGIPPEDRPRLFDRFHRATEQGGGAGLGLAIGDSIVRSTGGRWKIGESPLGGARVEVCWRRAQQRPDGALSDLVDPAVRIGQGSELDP